MVGLILKQWMWDVYDSIARLMGWNLVLFVIGAPVVFLAGMMLVMLAGAYAGPALVLSSLAIWVAITTVLGTIWFASTLHFGWRSSREQELRLRDFPLGIRVAGKRVFRFLLSISCIYALLALNVWFYLFSGIFFEPLSAFCDILSGACIWIGVILTGVLLHGLPLIARKDRSLKETYRLAMYLNVKYPLVTTSVLFTVISVLVIGTVCRFIGLLMGGLTLTAMLINSMHDVLLDMEEKAERLKAEGRPIPKSWSEIAQQDAESEAERARELRYNRTFRDVIKPWE